MKYKHLALALGALLLPLGCDKPPVFRSFDISPRFFCSGDDVTFTIDTTNVTNRRLVGNGFEQKFPTTDLASFTRKTQFSESPFDVRGEVQKVGDISMRTPPPEGAVLGAVAPLLLMVNSLDNDTWKPPVGPSFATAQNVTTTSINPKIVASNHCGCSPAGACSCQTHPNGCDVQLQESDTQATARVFEIFFAKKDFGLKAKLIGVENCALLPTSSVVVTLPGGTVLQALGSTKSVTFPGISPAGTYRLDLQSDIKVKTGTVRQYQPAEACPELKNQTVPSCDVFGPKACSEIVDRVCLKLFVRCDP